MRAIQTHSEKPLRLLLMLLSVTWPLYLLGFYVGDSQYPASFSLFVYLAIFIYMAFGLFFKARFSKFRTLTFILLFYQAVIFFMLGRGGDSISSAVLLSAFALPFAYKSQLSISDKLAVLRALKLGFFISFGILLAEIFFSFQGIKIQIDFQNPLIRVLNIPEWERMRFFSSFDEPAHYAIYLVMAYAIFDYADVKKLMKFKIYEKALIGFATFVTLSMSGLILFILYITLARGMHLGRKGMGLELVRKLFLGGLFAMILFVAASFVFSNISSYFLDRFNRAIDTFTSAEFSAEGIRTNTIRILFFLEGIGQFIGYESNEAAGVFEITGDPKFKIANTIVNVVIRLGYIGLFIFGLLMFRMLKSISYGFLLIFVVFNFVLGFWISVLYWIPWLLIYLLYFEEMQKRSAGINFRKNEAVFIS